MPAYNNRGILTIQDVMRTAAAMEQLGKHVSAETNSCNNRRAVFSVPSMPSGYKKDKKGRLRQFSFEKPGCLRARQTISGLRFELRTSHI
jgi:hypothetical protein